MASDCKLCVLLGVTDSSDGYPDTHVEIHARQLELIGQDYTIDKSQTIPINGSHTGARNGQFPKEKSKKCALFRVCREIIIHGKGDSGIKCSQCKKSLRLQRMKKNTAASLINHACVHLNKDLFECRHCHLKFVSKSGVCGHLHRIHSLTSFRANYVDMIDDHQREIMDMVKLCFGKAPQKQLNVTSFGNQKQNIEGQTPLFKLTYNFIDKHQGGDLIQCNLCPRSISNNNRWNAAKNLLDHARWHFDKPIFACLLCQYSSSTEQTVISHLRINHKVAGSKQNFKDGSSEYFEDISSLLEDCFGDMKKERPPVISQEQKRTRQAQSQIRSKCGANLLLAERQLQCFELAQKFQRSGKLQCRICHVLLAVMKDGHARYVVIPMGHALSHLNKVLFTCRRCPHTSTTQTAMKIHMSRKHGVPSANEFDDRTDDFHAEFMDMLSKCFDWDLEPEDTLSDPIVTPKTYPCIIISRMHGNDLSAARHFRALELIKNHAKDGKIICLICSHPTPVSKRAGSQFVFRHAMSHLDKHFWPYRCKLCRYVSVDKIYIRHKHLKKVHKDNDAKEFEDVSDKFHSEIMECLSKCYDRSVESE